MGIINLLRQWFRDAVHKSSAGDSVRGVPSNANDISRWAIALGAVLGLYVVFAHVIVFDPYRINNYMAIPNEGCANGPVTLAVHYTLTKPTAGSPAEYLLTTYWERVSDGLVSAGIAPFEGSFEDIAYGTHTVPSPVLRIAPPLPGEWRLVSHLEINGRVLGFPRETSEDYKSERVFKVLPADSERCAPSS